jgi:hypothetical protein
MSKLERYNGALGRLSERKLASLTEAREPRRVLDDFWDSVTAYCLARGYWKHAKRTQRIEASANITPAFGPRFAFEKPDDLVRVYLVSGSKSMEPGFSYLDENGVWYADADTIYVTYISNDPAFGMDLSRWGAMFCEYVEARLALKAGPRVTNNKADLDVLIAEEKRAMNVALGVDSMEGPPAVPPLNSWVRARGGGSGRARWDGSWS